MRKTRIFIIVIMLLLFFISGCKKTNEDMLEEISDKIEEFAKDAQNIVIKSEDSSFSFALQMEPFMLLFKAPIIYDMFGDPILCDVLAIKKNDTFYIYENSEIPKRTIITKDELEKYATKTFLSIYSEIELDDDDLDDIDALIEKIKIVKKNRNNYRIIVSCVDLGIEFSKSTNILDVIVTFNITIEKAQITLDESAKIKYLDGKEEEKTVSVPKIYVEKNVVNFSKLYNPSYIINTFMEQFQIPNIYLRIGNEYSFRSYYYECTRYYPSSAIKLLIDGGDVLDVKGVTITALDGGVCKGQLYLEDELIDEFTITVFQNETTNPEKNNQDVVKEFVDKYNDFINQNDIYVYLQEKNNSYGFYLKQDPLLFVYSGRDELFAYEKEDKKTYKYTTSFDGISNFITKEAIQNPILEIENNQFYNKIITGLYEKKELTIEDFSDLEITKVNDNYQIKGYIKDFSPYLKDYLNVSIGNIDDYLITINFNFTEKDLTIAIKGTYKQTQITSFKTIEINSWLLLSCDENNYEKLLENSIIAEYNNAIKSFDEITDYIDINDIEFSKHMTQGYYKVHLEEGVYELGNNSTLHAYDLNLNELSFHVIKSVFHKDNFYVPEGDYYLFLTSRYENMELGKINSIELPFDETTYLHTEDENLYILTYESEDEKSLAVRSTYGYNNYIIFYIDDDNQCYTFTEKANINLKEGINKIYIYSLYGNNTFVFKFSKQ